MTEIDTIISRLAEVIKAGLSALNPPTPIPNPVPNPVPNDAITEKDHAMGPSRKDVVTDGTNPPPKVFQPEEKSNPNSFSNRTNPFEVGPAGKLPTVSAQQDFWSEEGQVVLIPAGSTDPELIRFQAMSYDDRGTVDSSIYAFSPRFALGVSDGDEFVKNQATYKANFKHPVGIARSEGLLTNEALWVTAGGFIGCAGTQTSRAAWDNHYGVGLPGLQFPANKVPTGIAISTCNELACISIIDTATGAGQLAVLLLEGSELASHTTKYLGLANEGSWTDFVPLGFVDLPFKKPSAVKVATNTWWMGPSDTNNKDLGQIDFTDPNVRAGLRSGDLGWAETVGTGGYAMVSSKEEGKVCFIDLAPVMAYVRDSYTLDFDETVKDRATGLWPMTFDQKPDLVPKIVATMDFTRPSALLCGLNVERWSDDVFKAYVAEESGKVSIIDTSSFMARWDWEKKNPLAVIGSIMTGYNPTSMCFDRFGEQGLPLIPKKTDGSEGTYDKLNGLIWVCSRGEATINFIQTYQGNAKIIRSIRDEALIDPVAIWMVGRERILTVADFNGQQIVQYRMFGTWDPRHGIWYPVGGPAGSAFERSGTLALQGHPFDINTANVN